MKKNHRKYVFPDGTNYPIIESSKTGMLLLATAEDVKKADRHDPYSCVLAQCAIRTGAQRAFIAGTIAYIVMPYQGEVCAVKFSVPMDTRRAIHHFDETGEMPAEGFVLSPLNNSERAATKKARNEKQKQAGYKWPRESRRPGPELRTYRYLSGHVRTRRDDD